MFFYYEKDLAATRSAIAVGGWLGATTGVVSRGIRVLWALYLQPTERQFRQYQLHIHDSEALDMWRLGVFARKPLGRADGAWYVQAELERSGRNAHAQLENLAPKPTPFDFEISSPNATIRRYDLAALLGMRLLRSPVRLLGGPVLSYMSRRELLWDNYN